MKKIFSIAALASVFLFAGCVTNPEKEVMQFTLPSPAAPLDVQQARADEYKDIVKDFPVRGVWCYIGAYDHVESREKVLSLVEEFGANRIYCLITSETQLDEDLEGAIVAAHEHGIPFEIAMDIFHFYPRKAGNRFLRAIRPASPGIPQMVEKLLKMHRDPLSPYRYLSGITVIANVHFFNADNLDYPADGLFVWSKHTFGPGLDNDVMMKITLNMLKNLPEFPPDCPLTIGVPDIYNEYVRDGKLTCGSIADFAATRDPAADILLIGSGNRPTEALNRIEDELKCEDVRPKSVILLGQIANHTSVENDKLRRRDWNDFIRTMRYLSQKCSGVRNFKGVVLGPMVMLKILQMEP